MKFFETQNRLLILILSMAILSSVAFQGTRGLYETTEGRYAECARQTLHTGDFEAPLLNGEYHWSKPPLTYLCIASGMAVLGENTWGVRVFLSVDFVLTVLGVYFLGVQLWGKEVAPLCALVYATSPFTYASANAVSTDDLLTLWETLAVLFFWFAVRQKKTYPLLLMWLSFGLAFLTKGPAALLPLCGVIPTYIILKRRDTHLPRFLTVSGLLIFALVGLGWYLFEALLEPGFLKYWISDELIGRDLRGEFDRNPQWYQPFTIYLPIILFGTGQWVLFLGLHYKDVPWPKGRWLRWLDWENGVEWTYLILSLFLSFLILSLITSRLPLYVLWLFIPLSLSLGKGLHWLVQNHGVSMNRLLYLAGCCLLLFVAGKRLAAEHSAEKDMKTLAQDLAPFLETHRPYHLIAAEGRHLNGLQFYLRRMIPTVPIPQLRGTVKHGSGPRVNLIVLVRERYLGKKDIVDLINSEPVTVHKIDKYWAVIVPETEPRGHG